MRLSSAGAAEVCTKVCTDYPCGADRRRSRVRGMSRVLVIDDEPRIVSFVRRALGGDGIAAEGVTDGARGLELVLTGMYQLVILVLLMPGMDGSTVLAQTMARRPQQPVVVLSALTDVETK